MNQAKLKEVGTEQLILHAAREVFVKKGFEGARMQEIADCAGINKALLHYYFRSKEKLFDAVFQEIAVHIYPAMQQIISAELGVVEKLTFFVQVYLKILSENPFIPAFIINTLNTSPERFANILLSSGINPEKLQMEIDKEVQMHKIRPIKVEHLFVNVLSMCVFPFVTQPIIKSLFNLDEMLFKKYMEERKIEIIEFVIKSISLS